jgi:hypothetical protein
MPLRSKGATAAEEAQASHGRRFGKFDYLQLEEGQAVVVRFVTEFDDWPSGDVHMGVPTKPAPKGKDGKPQQKWPAFMSALCREDKKNFWDPDTQEWDEGYGPGGCWIHNNLVGQLDKYQKDMAKTSVRCWALAVIREETGEPGARVARDAKTADGKRKIVVVNQAYYGFFSQLNGIAQANGSTVDRDMWIKKKEKGGGNFSEYSIIPRDRDPDHHPGTESWDSILAEILERNLDLDEMVLNTSSQDYYDKFFNPAVETKATDEEEEDAAAAEGQPAAPDDEALKAMQARVRSAISGEAVPSAEEEAKTPGPARA